MFDPRKVPANLPAARKATKAKTQTQLLARVSELPFQYPDLAELDLNPVFLFPDHLVIGDARAIRSKATKERQVA